MNKTYRLLWDIVHETWIVVAEKVSSKGSRAVSVVVGGLLVSTLYGGVAPVQALELTALPTGGQVVSGSATISQSGSAMIITQATTKMIATWDSFNIGQQAAVTFQQPNAASVALNRISDQSPTQILGSLSANGQIFLLNPSGIIFGQTAQVNVGALVASSLNLTNENFLNGSYRFENAGAAGAVINQGSIRTADGGYLAFLAPQIKNEGSITANQGSVVMAAADKVTLDFTGDGLLSYSVEQGAVDALVENKGLVKGDGGLVVMTAKAADSLTSSVVNNDGAIEAQTITNRAGRIILDAEGGTTTVTGTLDASSADGHGGRIIATGERVWVKDSAHLTTSGATGGGEVLVGGSWQNSDTTVRQATGTIVEQGTLLEANASDTGNGGTVVAWSDITNPLSVTRAYGTFEAKGGVNGGDGGRIETSGHWLEVAGITANASAPKGVGGEWLLDPYNVTIGSSASGTAYGSSYTPAADSTIRASDIASSLQGGTSVTITTGTNGSSIGDITVSSAITKASGDTNVTLTLQAANSIIVDQAISNTGGTGKLNVLLDADNSSNGTRDGAGIIILNNTITTNGGNLSFGTGATLSINGVSTLVGGDVFVSGSAAQTLSTNGGNVDVKGEMLIANTNGLTIDSSGGNVHFYGLLNSGNSYTSVNSAKTWSEALSAAASGTGTGTGTGDTYLATITSRLENAIAGRAVNYQESWLGARRVTGIGTDTQWRWVTGPEGVANSGAGTPFFTQTGNGTGTVISGYYANWSTNEPNNYVSGAGSTTYTQEYESVLQFTGNLGKWNDLTGGPSADSNTPQTLNSQTLNYYVKETNLAASPLTITAGTGTVTFTGAVGTSKSLASLNVTSTGGIAINGGAVTTQGIQTYSGNVTLGSASTVLTQTTASTDFTVQESKTITNSSGADAALTIKTTGNIIMQATSGIGATTDKLSTILWSDTDATDGGGIWIKTGASITSNGGTVTLSGGADYTTGYAKGTTTISPGTTFGQRAGIMLSGNISSGVGSINLRGEMGAVANGTSVDSAALYLSQISSITSTSGNISLSGRVGADAASSAPIRAVRLGDGITSTSQATITTTTGSITLLGDAALSNSTGGSGILLDSAKLQTTSGNITLTGIQKANAEADVFFHAGTSDANNTTSNIITSTTGNVLLNMNSFLLFNTNTVSSGGSLTIQPRTAGTTIGIAGGTGTLSLLASYFTTNFLDGFSGITIGNATAGGITVGGATTLNDSTTLLNNAAISINGAVTANENLILAGNGAITQTGALTVTGTTTLTAGSTNDITLTNSDNNFTGAVSVVSGKDVGLRDLNALVLGASTVSGNLGVTSSGAITQTGALTVTGTTTLTAGSTNDITLTNSDNNFTAAVSVVSGKDVGLRDLNALVLGASTVSGNLGVTSSGAITQTGALTVTGTTTLTAGSTNDITLTSSDNNFTGAVSVVSGKDVGLRDLNALVLGASTVSGNLGVTSSGAITQTGALTVTGTTTLTAGSTNDITLTNSDNNFTGAVGVVSGKEVGLRDQNALVLGASTVSGNLGVTSSGAITQTGALTVTGITTLTAGSTNDITLTNSDNNFTGAVGVVSGKEVGLRDQNAVVLGASTVSGNLGVTSSGAITQTGALTVTGTTTLTAGSTNDITLTNSDNNFTADVSVVSGKDVGLRDLNALVLGASTVSGNLGVTSSGAITQTGALTVTGTTTLTAGSTNDITLTSSDNNFTGAVSVVSGKDVGLRDLNALVLGASTVSGNLGVTSSGAITQTGALTVTGTTTLTAGSTNDITLTNSDNNFTGAVGVVSGKNIAATDSNGMTIGVMNAAGTITLTTLTNNLTLSGALSTSNATADAIRVIAGKDSAIGTATGGDVIIDGGSISLTGGGAARATIFTGALINANLTALVGAGSDRFRYHADETTDFSSAGWTALGTGVYAVYRQQPVLTVSANSITQDYSGIAYAGGNGVTYSGFVNGDTTTILSGTLAYGGTSQGAIAVGNYTIVPSGYSNGRGYSLSYLDGALGIRATTPTLSIDAPIVTQIQAWFIQPQRQWYGGQEYLRSSERAPQEKEMPSLEHASSSNVVEGTLTSGLIVDRTGYRTSLSVDDGISRSQSR